jgi:hypothetical protein
MGFVSPEFLAMTAGRREVSQRKQWERERA